MNVLLNNFLNDTEKKLNKTLDVLKLEFSKIVVNKANIGLIKSININCYNEKYNLEQISTITVESNTIIYIKPFDKQYITVICNEIVKLNLDLNPFVASDAIKIVFPSITMDRRKAFVKKIKVYSEDTKVSIRNIRKNTNQELKNFLKLNKVSEDDEKKFHIELQKLTDNYIEKIDILTQKKENELLKI